VLAFRKNEIAFSQGDVAAKVFYIQKGKVKVVVLSEQGKEAVVGIFEPRQFFARGSLRLRSGGRTACWKKSARPGAGVINSAHSMCRADAQVIFDSDI
jgi:CRP-like cAMP-binding protein